MHHPTYDVQITIGGCPARLSQRLRQSSRDSFTLLATHKVIDADLAVRLQKMVGLRNIAVHDYQALNLDIVIYVLHHHLDDFTRFSHQVMALAN